MTANSERSASSTVDSANLSGEMLMKMNRVDKTRLQTVIAAAKSSARLRMNDNLHAMDDTIHRLLNATEPGTYVQPHRHGSSAAATTARTETLCVLTGLGAIVTFGDDGEILEEILLGPNAECALAEIPGATWHTLIALESGTVWFEVKQGPYAPLPPQDLAAWAPAPGSAAASEYLERLRARLDTKRAHRS